MKIKSYLKRTWSFHFEEGLLFSKNDINKILFPVIFETLLAYLIGLMDSIMVATVGEAAVSAVSLVDAIGILFINIFSALANGGAVVCGQYLGRKLANDSENAAEQMIFLLLVSSIVISAVLLVFQEHIIHFLYGSADIIVRENCNIYYHIVMTSVPFIALYNGGAALFRITGDSFTPLKVSVIMNAINIFGNALLIFVFKMGIAGVAIPTLISRGIAMVIILIPLIRENSPLKIFKGRKYKLDKNLISSILSIGIPNGIENGMFEFGKLILMTLISTLSTAAITANAIGNTISSINCVIGVATNSALMAVVSRCAGAEKFTQARWYTRYFIKKTYVLQGIVNIALIIGIPLILRLYNTSAQVEMLVVPIMILHGMSTLVLWPLAFMLNISMRSAGDSKYAMWVTIISMWICRVGGSYVLVKVVHLGVLGVWVAWSIDWIFRILFFLPRYLGKKWEISII